MCQQTHLALIGMNFDVSAFMHNSQALHPVGLITFHLSMMATINAVLWDSPKFSLLILAVGLVACLSGECDVKHCLASMSSEIHQLVVQVVNSVSRYPNGGNGA